MNHYPPTQQLVKDLHDQLSAYRCKETPISFEQKKYFEKTFNHRKGLRDYSVTIFDLYTKHFTFHDSLFNKYLKYPSLSPAVMDNMKTLNDLTEPQNLRFCLDTMIKSIEFISNLSPAEWHQFHVRYIRRLLEKDGQYHPYLHYMYVNEYDPEGKPWLITIESKRLRDMNMPELRKFSPATPHYCEEHLYSARLLNVKLDEIDRELIKKHDEDCKKKALSRELYKSPHTVSNRYNKVNALFDVNSINTTCLIAKIMELV